jgi:hypothetical protein
MNVHIKTIKKEKILDINQRRGQIGLLYLLFLMPLALPEVLV